jgi:hypothetical protein
LEIVTTEQAIETPAGPEETKEESLSIFMLRFVALPAESLKIVGVMVLF